MSFFELFVRVPRLPFVSVLLECINAPNRQRVERIVRVSFLHYILDPKLSSNDEFVEKDFHASLNLFIAFMQSRKPSRAFGDVQDGNLTVVDVRREMRLESERTVVAKFTLFTQYHWIEKRFEFVHSFDFASDVIFIAFRNTRRFL